MTIMVIKGAISMSTKKRTNKSYSFELKLDAVQRVLAGESVINVAKRLEVTDPDYIYKCNRTMCF